MVRKNRNTTLDDDLYKKIQILAIELSKNTNDLLEEAMRLVLEKYGKLEKE